MTIDALMSYQKCFLFGLGDSSAQLDDRLNALNMMSLSYLTIGDPKNALIWANKAQHLLEDKNESSEDVHEEASLELFSKVYSLRGTIPYHTIPYRTIPYHTIKYHQ